MMKNSPTQKGKKSSFDPFMMSLLSGTKGMDPLMSMMMMQNKDVKDMGPLLPLFFAGKTNQDPLLMTMLLSQQANPNVKCE